MRLGAILGKSQAALWEVARANEKAKKAEDKRLAKEARRDRTVRYKKD